jgi:hypothetical protein
MIPLTSLKALTHTPCKCLKTRIVSGMPPRQSVVFFTPNGFVPMGAMGHEHNTRKGNSARSANYEFSTFAPANSLGNELADFQKSQLGARP